MIGDVQELQVTDYHGDGGNCSSWSVVAGFHNGSSVLAVTTQQQASVSTQARTMVYDPYR